MELRAYITFTWVGGEELGFGEINEFHAVQIVDPLELEMIQDGGGAAGRGR